MRFLFFFVFVNAAVWASDTDRMVAPFMCASLVAARGATPPSTFLYDFVPPHETDAPHAAVYGALEWVTQLMFQGVAGKVFVKTGTPQELAHFFYLMAEDTDVKVAAAWPWQRKRRDCWDRGGVRPVPSPARHLQIGVQCLFSRSIDDLEPEFMTVLLPRRAASWEREIAPAGTELPREMGILFTRDGTGERLRVAFLFVDPPR